ncbi:MAG TPA: alpha/beta hydrolase fold domain-containing protein [Bryobacteraceae bacterium]|jgi:acetyl esterase/lipase|nr:alpha/beta hydrolase fold domain-containing protein [Bryobacteraceae bacterium]
MQLRVVLGVMFAVAALSIRPMSSAAQTKDARQVPQTNSSYIDKDGTAHVTRIVPVPTTVSPEAQKSLARQQSDALVPQTLEQRRSGTDTWQKGAGEAARKVYPVQSIEDQTIAGVPTRVITPLEVPQEKRDRILLNVHGGGFNSDSGSFTETIPIANLTKTKTIAILYRLAPEHPFPAAVEDTVAVYKEMLKTYQPKKIALYGTSAGAILTAEVAAKLKQLGLPLPGVLGIFSGMGDFSKQGDSWSIFALNGFSGYLAPPGEQKKDTSYTGTTDVQDPVLSPVFGDLKSMPPTLFVTSTRDLLLSGTVNLHRAFLHAGVDAQLVVFDALPHAFWNNVNLAESREADALMAQFFDEALRQ